MKRLFGLLLAFAFACLSIPAFAANSATVQTAQKMRIAGVGPVTPYVVAIDTTGEDLTIHTPGSANMACVAGLLVSDATAATWTFKSGTTTLWVPEFTTYREVIHPLGDGILFCTQPGEALIIQSSAAVSNMLLHVVEGNNINLR